MIISYNFYYALPGAAAAVLQQRIKASDVRVQLGLARGRAISKVEGGDEWPDVIWRLDFAAMAAQDGDMLARAASPEFEAIRHGMRRLYRRFERPLYAPCSSKSPAPIIGAQHCLLLHGVYCDASVSAAARAVLATIPAAEFISGASGVPHFLCETGSTGLPPTIVESLRRLPVRLEHSVWQVADGG